MDIYIIVVSAFICAAALVFWLSTYLKRERLLPLGTCSVSKKYFVLKFCSTLTPKYIIELIVNRLGDKSRLNIGNLLIHSGLEDSFTTTEYISAGVSIPIIGSLITIFILGLNSTIVIITGLVISIFGLHIYTRHLIRRRKEEIELALPTALDWLTLSVEAGLDFMQAISRVATRLQAGPLKTEVNRMLATIRVGSSRQAALKTFSKRCNSPFVSSFVTLLIQADVLGASIGPVLKAHSERLRTERFAKAEKRGILAAGKALLPLTFCIMPTSFIVIFGPLIVRFVTGGFAQMFGGE